MLKIIFSLLSCLLFTLGLAAQNIVAGPMLGYNTMREAAVWVQMDQPATLQVEFWDKENPEIKRKSEIVIALQAKANTATLVMELLEPGTNYEFRLVNGTQYIGPTLSYTTQELWQYRKPAPDFSFLAGSCSYINDTAYDRLGEPYGGEYEIYETMAKEPANFMIWLGDNTYLRPADWSSRSGIYHRFGHSRGIPELQPLLKGMHHFAIWDDHDYGPNDSDWSFWNKDITREAFVDFWANPNYGVGGSEGITGTFTWNDCQFFLLDNRWYRTKDDANGTILGEQQIKWLIDALRFSPAQFKFICIGGQFISDFQMYENHANYALERMQIINQLDKHEITGVIFLDGDRHHSEISKMETRSGQVYYDVTSSPLTSGSYDHSQEPNHFRIPGTSLDVRSYAHISVTGATEERKVTVQLKGVNGKTLVTQELEFPKEESEE